MVEIKNLSFGYGKRPVLTEFSARFQKGKFYGIIGPNGCGKSTLLNLISGLIKAESGNIFVENQEVSLIQRKAIAKKISLMPQTRPTPDMTVGDLVMCGRFPYRNDKENSATTDENAVLKALDSTCSLHLINRPLKELSGGERQRVYLAMLLAQDTDIILCDEPTTHLDIGNSLAVMQILKDVKSQEKCVIAVLHDISHALRFCDEIILMNNGFVVDSGTPEDLVNNKSIDKVFGVTITPIKTENSTNYVIE